MRSFLVVAEDLELWTEKTPERRLDRTPLFGAARDLERLEQELAEAEPAPPPVPTRPRRERGPFVTYLCLPWSYGDGDRRIGDSWHRMKCRLQRHQMVGGNMVQVGGEVVFLERTCRWCGGAEAGPS